MLRPDSGAPLVRPPLVRLSREKIDPQGIYLLENGQSILVWIARQANPALIEATFVAAPLPSPASQALDASLARASAPRSRYTLAEPTQSEFAAKIHTLIASLRADWSVARCLPLIQASFFLIFPEPNHRGLGDNTDNHSKDRTSFSPSLPRHPLLSCLPCFAFLSLFHTCATLRSAFLLEPASSSLGPTLWWVCRAGMTYEPVRVLHEDDEHGGVLGSYLIEDTWPRQLSYPEFLCAIHSQIGGGD